MKKLLYLPLLALTLACQFVTGAPARQTTDVPSEPTQAIVNPIASRGITIVRLHKQNGDLMEQLSAEAKKAAALGQMPIAYFDASW